MNPSKDKKSGLKPSQSQSKLAYRPPRLTEYGKLSNLVEGGSAGAAEMGGMMANRRA
jgi:hypothetical protein